MKAIFKTMLAGCALVATTSLFAQDAPKTSGFHVRLNVGYGFSTSKDVFSITDAQYNASNTKISEANLYGTLGGGPTFHLGVGYFVNQYLGFELDGYFLLGSKNTVGHVQTPTLDLTVYASSQQIRLAPSMVLRMGGNGKFKPYTRFGIVLPLGGKTVTEEKTHDTSNSPYDTDKITEIHGAFTVGFESGAGVAYNITDNISITAEATYTGLRIQAKTGKITTNQLVKDGTTTNYLETATVSDKEYNFVDKLTTDSNNPFFKPHGLADMNKDKPLDQLARRSNFNAVSIRIGVAYKF